ncbi:outer membrane protein OmpA-like peptidoglycan-associated protein [Sphingomonas zeicaulis]|uniref:protein kinase domain-containing protein n=1 Tax=Sphingomonas zeicaulis TaxID=1632740 RepID=UPI003D1E9ED9
MQAAADFHDALPAGTAVGDFVLGEAIGQGGEGIVYAARHPRFGAVLLKEYWPKQLISRGSGGVAEASRAAWAPDLRRGVERFLALGERMAALPDHPGIVRIHAAFPANNTAYLAMERVEGQPLATVLAEGAMRDPADIMTLADQLSDAIAFLHHQELFHRDIAPDNVIVTPGRDWRAVLIDFNAAKDLMVELTRSVAAVVKPGYSPVEQYHGAGSEAPGPASDLYSAGAVLYRAITGEPPQEASRRLYRGDHSTLVALAPPGFQRGFLAAIDHALQPRPEDRPASADHWRRELGVVAGGAVAEGKATQPAPTPMDMWRLRASRDEASTTMRGPAPPPVATPPAATQPTVAQTTVRDVATAPSPSRAAAGAKGGQGPVTMAILALVLLAALGAGGLLAWNAGWLRGGGGIVAENASDLIVNMDDAAAEELNNAADAIDAPNGAVEGAGPAVTPPKPLNARMWVGEADYPPGATRNGDVGIAVDVDAAGKPLGCETVNRSGIAAYDGATCRLVTARARFDPALDAAGAKVAGRYTGTVKWMPPVWQVEPDEEAYPEPAAVSGLAAPGQCELGPYIVFFDWDKTDITPEAAAILDNFIGSWQRCKSPQIMLAGHTDREGSAAYNAGKSRRMAGSVSAYLTSHGVPASIISTQSFGEGQPRVPTADGVREMQNRRVELTAR